MRTDEQQRAAIVRILREAIPGLRGVYLFGSRAGTGEHAHAQSDYDIAVDGERGSQLTGLARLRVINALADALAVDRVDLVDLNASTIGHLLRMWAIDGDRLYASDPAASLEREAKWATMAADFAVSERELREAQLTRIRSHG